MPTQSKKAAEDRDEIAVSVRFAQRETYGPGNSKEQQESGRQLVEFLKSELSACLTFVDVAEKMRQAGKHELAEQAVGNAEKSYTTALPFVSDPGGWRFSGSESQELTAQFERVREKIEELTRFKRVAARAYQLWEARGRPDGTSQEDWLQAERELQARKN